MSRLNRTELKKMLTADDFTISELKEMLRQKRKKINFNFSDALYCLDKSMNIQYEKLMNDEHLRFSGILIKVININFENRIVDGKVRNIK